MEARATKPPRVSARFSKSLARRRLRPNQEKVRSMCSRGTLATAASTCHALYRPVTPECVRDADCLLEGSRFEPSVPPANGPLRQNANDFREIEKGRKYPFSRGTGSS